LSQPARDFYVSSSEERPLAESPSRPGLFIDPLGPQEVGEEASALAARPVPPGPVWDAAVAGVLAEEGRTPAPDLLLPPVPAAAPVEEVETDEPASARSAAALAGLAVAIWGTWQYRSRRSDRGRRHQSAAPALPAV
jgi:hypothetical protein